MLAYLARTLPVVLRARSRSGETRVSRLCRRVWLSEIDVNLHMNQAVYLQVMELGRVDQVLRSGAWDRWRAQDVKPVVADQHIVYRRELKPLATYTLDTRAVAVEGRLLRFESHLVVGDRVHARGEARMLFVGASGVLRDEEVEPLCDGLLAEPLRIEDWRVVEEG